MQENRPTPPIGRHPSDPIINDVNNTEELQHLLSHRHHQALPSSTDRPDGFHSYPHDLQHAYNFDRQLNAFKPPPRLPSVRPPPFVPSGDPPLGTGDSSYHTRYEPSLAPYPVRGSRPAHSHPPPRQPASLMAHRHPNLSAGIPYPQDSMMMAGSSRHFSRHEPRDAIQRHDQTYHSYSNRAPPPSTHQDRWHRQQGHSSHLDSFVSRSRSNRSVSPASNRENLTQESRPESPRRRSHSPSEFYDDEKSQKTRKTDRDYDNPPSKASRNVTSKEETAWDGPRSRVLKLSNLEKHVTTDQILKALRRLRDPNDQTKQLSGLDQLQKVSVVSVAPSSTQDAGSTLAFVSFLKSLAAREVALALRPDSDGRIQLSLPAPTDEDGEITIKSARVTIEPLGHFVKTTRPELAVAEAVDGEEFYTWRDETITLVDSWKSNKLVTRPKKDFGNVIKNGSKHGSTEAPLKEGKSHVAKAGEASRGSGDTKAEKWVPVTVTSKKVFLNISKWNQKQEELRDMDEIRSEPTNDQPKMSASKSVADSLKVSEIPSLEPCGLSEKPSISSGSKAGPMSEEELGCFDYKDEEQRACLLCQRKFKSIDTLHRHVNESQLHKVNLASLETCRTGVERKASINVAAPSGFIPIGTKKDQDSLPSGTAEAAPKYRDRALERRAVFGADLPQSNANNKANTFKLADNFPGPQPDKGTASPVVLAEEKPIGSDNVGNKLLAMMGWTQGQGLGASGQGRSDIIETKMYTKGAGLGSVKSTSETKPPLFDGWKGYQQAAKEGARERYGEDS